MPNKSKKISENTPKNFQGAIKRLLKEMTSYKVWITMALLLAMVSSILSILAPNKLKDLTNEIQQGLIVNTENLEIFRDKLSENFEESKIQEELPKILNIRLDETTIQNVFLDKTISQKDKTDFKNGIEKVNDNNLTQAILQLPSSTWKYILPTSYYKNNEVSTEKKVDLIRAWNNNPEESISFLAPFLLEELTIDGVEISIEDQQSSIQILQNEKIETSNAFYEIIEKLPQSIQTIAKPKMNISAIKNITLFLGILYICSAIFNFIQTIIMTNVSNYFAKALRKKIIHKINALPLQYFDTHITGDILSRITNDVDTVSSSMNQSLASLVSAITLFIGTVTMMFATNWIMAITAIISSLLGFGFLFLILGKSQKYFIERQKNLGELNGYIEEIYSGLNVVKVYNGTQMCNKKFDKLNKKLYDANRKSQFLSGLMPPMMGFVGNLGYVAVCIVGALLTMNNQITFGVIVAFITYVRLFTSPLSQIAQALTSLQSTASASERVFEFLDEKEMSPLKEVETTLENNEVKGKIEFQNVLFTYTGNDKPTIHNFSALANPGEKIAIVGPTGAGKTTMVNLLMKFYDLNGGDIKIDGVSIKNLTRENIHQLFTMVLQDTWIFDGTIKENIIYNRKNVSDEKVKEVCKIIGLDHFIKTLPKGYDTEITGNEYVSQGQKQLITIARGMIEDAPFLILDEATSNVDTRTEELVQSAMDKLMEGRTSFIIAHRLSTIRNADLILVMKDGNIIEQGTHNELIEQKGFYYDLYNSQFEL